MVPLTDDKLFFHREEFVPEAYNLTSFLVQFKGFFYLNYAETFFGIINGLSGQF